MGEFILSKDGKTLLGYDGDCPNEIEIPHGVETIKKEAFLGIGNLKKVKFNPTIKKIEERAFAETGIESVSLPSSLSYLSNDAFTYMTMGRQKSGNPYETVTTLKIDKQNEKYFTDDNCLYETTDEGYTLVLCFKGNVISLKIGEGTTIIKNNAFKFCKYLKSIELPDTLIKIEDGALKGLELDYLVIPAATIDIGKSELSYLKENIFVKGVIADYYKSTFIKVDAANPIYSTECGCFMKKEEGKTILLHSFQYDCAAVNIPKQTTHIASNAFKNCERLKTVVFSEELKEIGAGAFENCSKIQRLTLPSSIETIGKNAFSKCAKLEIVEFLGGNVCIGDGAFSQCYNLTTVILGEGDARISDTTFEECDKNNMLLSCELNPKAEEYAKANNIPISAKTFSEAFEYIVSKKNTVKITKYKSTSKNVVIPDNIDGLPVVSLGKDLFRNNSLIESVTWPAEIPVLPKEIFFGCKSLKKIIIPKGVTEISEKAFRNCMELKEIYIPSSVTQIHEKAFECAIQYVYGWEYHNNVERILAKKGSYAVKFAKSNGIEVELIEE